MEGPIATWYTKNTGRGLRLRWFIEVGRAVANRVTAGGRVLEVAPRPGFLAIEIAKSGRCSVTGLDISESFVRIALEKLVSQSRFRTCHLETDGIGFELQLTKQSEAQTNPPQALTRSAAP